MRQLVLCVVVLLSVWSVSVASLISDIKQATVAHPPDKKSLITVVANNNAMQNWLPAPAALDQAALDEMDRKAGEEVGETKGPEAEQKYNTQQKATQDKDEANEKEYANKETQIKTSQESNDKSLMESGEKASARLQKQISDAMQENTGKEQQAKNMLSEQATKRHAASTAASVKNEAMYKEMEKGEKERRADEQKQKKTVQDQIDAKNEQLKQAYSTAEAQVKRVSDDYSRLGASQVSSLRTAIEDYTSKTTKAVTDGTRVVKTGHCYVWGDPHITTFGASKYDWYGTGEYIMYLDKNTEEQINAKFYKAKSSCNLNSATGAVALRWKWLNIALETKNPWDACTKGMGGMDIRLYIDVSRRAWQPGTTYFTTELSNSPNIKMESLIPVQDSDTGPRKLIATISNPATKTVLQVHLRTQQFCCMYTLDLHLSIDGYNVPATSTFGMCGRWAGEQGKDNDLYSLTNAYAAKNSVGSFAASYLVERTETLFVLHRNDQIDAGESVRAASAQPPEAFFNGAAGARDGVIARAKTACQSITDADMRRACQVDVIVCGEDDKCAQAAALAAIEEATRELATSPPPTPAATR